MKRECNIYNEITDIDNIKDIYQKQIRINTKNKGRIEKFEDYYIANMSLIKEMLDLKNVIFSNYNIFLIKSPKVRIIMSQTIKDKIINHLVAKYFLVDVLNPSLIDQNVATRVGKGTHYGIKLTKKYLNEIKAKHKYFYILKCDISKYFYSINHEILKKKVMKKIKDKDALDIIFKVIDTTDNDYIKERILKLKEKEIIKINKLDINDKESKICSVNKLPIYEKGRGLPIGNMSSQILAIYYLNDLDHYIKEKLKIKYYIRYMDDFVLIHQSKEYLQECLNIIKEKIEKEYDLKLNSKTSIINIKNGLDFLGFRFIIRDNKIIMRVRTDTKKRFKKKVKELSGKKLRQVIASYRGHIKYGNTYYLEKKILGYQRKTLDIGIEL